MASRKTSEGGFSLLELSLAVAISLTILASSFWMLKQQNSEARIQQSKMMLATIRTNLSAYRYRFGSYPSYTEFQRNWATPSANAFQIIPGASRSATEITTNGGAVNEPVSGAMRVYDRNPNRSGGAEATTSYGGWLYDSTTGSASVNLDPSKYPGDNPNLW